MFVEKFSNSLSSWVSGFWKQLTKCLNLNWRWGFPRVSLHPNTYGHEVVKEDSL